MSQQLKNIIFLYYLDFAFVSICISHSQSLDLIFGSDLRLKTCIRVIFLAYIPLGFVFLSVRVFFTKLWNLLHV